MYFVNKRILCGTMNDMMLSNVNYYDDGITHSIFFNFNINNNNLETLMQFMLNRLCIFLQIYRGKFARIFFEYKIFVIEF